MTGVDPINPGQACLGVDPKTNKIGFVNQGGGALGVMSQGIALLYTPPAHTSSFIAYMGENFGIAKKSYAQGVGFNAISPLIPIWTIFRNITYSLFVFIFVLIGLAIMLRAKIDPRTVMTVQNQIPKIIIGLILITFSFAIAGFLIDLMYISIYIIYSVLSGVIDLSTLSPQAIQGQNVINAAGHLQVDKIAGNVALSGKDTINLLLGVSPTGIPLVGDIANAFGTIFSITHWESFRVFDLVYDLISLLTAFRIGAAAATISTVPIIGTAAGVGAGLAAFTGMEFFLRNVVPYLLIYLIVIVAVFFTLFKVFFMLLKAYVFIILDIIFAPFWIVSGLVPGISEGKGFSAWIRDIVANLAVFPAVYTMFLLANVVGSAFIQSSNLARNTTGFAPPLLGNPLAYNFIGHLISLGLILLTPEVAKMIRNAVKAPQMPGGLGALSVGASVVGAPFAGFKNEFFGKNAMGERRTGSAWIGDKFGVLAQAATGGGFSRKSRTEGERIPLVRVPSVSSVRGAILGRKPSVASGKPAATPEVKKTENVETATEKMERLKKEFEEKKKA
jgi:hypothetical protein